MFLYGIILSIFCPFSCLIFGVHLNFPHNYVNGEIQTTILTSINATSLQTTVIPLDFSSVNYMLCDIDGDGTPDDLSVNNAMTLSADGNTAYILWGSWVAVVDLTTPGKHDI